MNSSTQAHDWPSSDSILSELSLPITARAFRLAMDAHENHFSSRRGVFETDESGLLDLYDNNPYHLRDEQIRVLVSWLASAGHKLVGTGSYPEDGESKGYTICLTIRPTGASPDAERQIVRRWQEIIVSTSDADARKKLTTKGGAS